MEWSIGMESRRAHRCYVIVMVWNGMTYGHSGMEWDDMVWNGK